VPGAIRALPPRSALVDAWAMTEPEPGSWELATAITAEGLPWQRTAEVARLRLCRQLLAGGAGLRPLERKYPDQVFVLYWGEQLVLPSRPGTFPLLHRPPDVDGRLPPREEPDPWPGLAPRER